jgi:hypothetical protein
MELQPGVIASQLIYFFSHINNDTYMKESEVCLEIDSVPSRGAWIFKWKLSIITDTGVSMNLEW